MDAVQPVQQSSMAVMNAGDLIVRPTDNPIRSAGQTSNLQAAV
jgi:hypothetical protein